MAKRPIVKSKSKASAKPTGKTPPKKANVKAGLRPAAKGKKARSSPRTVTVTIPQTITLDLPPALHDRLKSLSGVMDLPMEAVVRQALLEFADTWEEHHRTVAALAESSDRMVVVREE